MKKLMILAAIVCAASFCHAAKASWCVTSSKAAGISYDGATVYFVLASDVTAFKNLAAVQAVAKQSATLNSAAFSGTTGNQYANSWVTAGESYTWKAVVVDENEYFVSDSATMTAVSDTGTPSTSTIKTQTAMETASNWTAFSDAPEPTSGLLLLVGMGALALRRRRA